jgi:hypothetical protein
MQITKVTYNQLRDGGVDMGEFGKLVNSAVSKREVSKETFSQSGKAFTRSEASKIARNELTDSEDFALTVLAFDTAMAKAAKTWGLADWKVPAAMVANAKVICPFRAETPATATVPAE